jgi:hypothetical protein
LVRIVNIVSEASLSFIAAGQQLFTEHFLA